MNRSRAYLATFLSLILLLATVVPAPGLTRAQLEQSRQQAAEARERAANAREQAADEQAEADVLRREVDLLDGQMSTLTREIQALQPQIKTANERTTQLNNEVAALRDKIAQKEAEIAEVEADHSNQTELLSDRLTTTYKQGNDFFLEMIFQAQDLRDFIARTTLVQRVMESDRDIMRRLEATQANLERIRAEHALALESVEIKRQEAALIENNLRKLNSQRQTALAQQQAAQDQKAALLTETAANADRLRKIADDEDRESARIEAELRARTSQGSGTFDGEMAWPTPGFYRVSSGFGFRIHPIHRDRRMHWGIDIAGPQINGEAVVAAEDGVVVSAGNRRGYGVTVIVDHGNGVSTLYAHLLTGSINVRVGQQVERGQRLASVGSTGASTGPHLHFEVRINGSPVDPMPYLR